MSKRWEEMSLADVERLDKGRIIFLSTGSIEVHGRHLPVGTDSVIADDLASRVCSKFNAIRGPRFDFGPCETLLQFPGTLTVSEHTFEEIVKEIVLSLNFHGFHKICIINGHGGNIAPLTHVIKWLKSNHKQLKILLVNWYDMPSLVKLKRAVDTYKGDHADRAETEMMLHISNKSVRLDNALDDLPVWPSNFEDLDDYSGIMKYAVEGFPTASKLSTAHKLYHAIVYDLVAAVDSFFVT